MNYFKVIDYDNGSSSYGNMRYRIMRQYPCCRGLHGTCGDLRIVYPRVIAVLGSHQQFACVVSAIDFVNELNF